jgi:hypothetical protein
LREVVVRSDLSGEVVPADDLVRVRVLSFGSDGRDLVLDAGRGEVERLLVSSDAGRLMNRPGPKGPRRARNGST